MKGKKLEAQENRLNRVKAQVEAHKKVLKERGLDEKLIKKDSMMRHLLADARKLKRSIESLQWEPPKVDPAAKQAEKSAEPAEKPAKEAKPKAPKPPKEKKPKKEEKASPA